jgi:hypothetical protein
MGYRLMKNFLLLRQVHLKKFVMVLLMMNCYQIKIVHVINAGEIMELFQKILMLIHVLFVINEDLENLILVLEYLFAVLLYLRM